MASSAEGAVNRRLTEDKPLKLAFLPFVFSKSLKRTYSPASFRRRRRDHLRKRMVEDTLSLRKGILSAALPAKPPLKGEVPA